MGGALFRFVPFVVNSSLDVSVFSASPTFGTAILTLGLQTVVIPIREVGAPLEVRSSEKNISETSSQTRGGERQKCNCQREELLEEVGIPRRCHAGTNLSMCSEPRLAMQVLASLEVGGNVQA